MDMTPQEYQSYVQQRMKKSPLLKDVCLSFVIGGAICVLGQAIQNGWAAAGLSKEDAGAATSCTLVFLSALLTGLGVYDRIGKYAGAGSIIPITGFANATVAPAMEFRREGLVMGIGAKIFTLSGPVLVYGIGSSILVGLIAALAGVIG